MFDNEIDVSEIMRDIKKSVVGDTDECPVGCDEVSRITNLINSRREENQSYMDIGIHLPQALRFPKLIRKIIILISRLIRKSTRFIANDQIVVNYNVDACIKALIEREDAIVKNLEEEIIDLRKTNELLYDKIEKMGELDEHIN